MIKGMNIIMLIDTIIGILIPIIFKYILIAIRYPIEANLVPYSS